jgi:hypothetical protein
MARRKTDEERTAEKIVDLVSDLRLDLDEVGETIAVIAPNVSYRRLVEITEATQHAKEGKDFDVIR